MLINQSTVKKVGHLSACPARYYHEEVVKDVDRKYSLAMRQGHFFEYLCLGTRTKEGRIPVLPRLKSGKKSTAHLRIEQQAKKFRQECRRLGIIIAKADYHASFPINEKVKMHGTMDSLIEWNGKPYVMDLKFTGNVESTFGNFAWGDFSYDNADKRGVIYPDGSESMDLIQADLYPYLMKQLTGAPWGFLYAVFDSSPKMGFKFIEIPHNPERLEYNLERMNSTASKLKKFEQMEYPAIPSLSECKECKFKKCEERISIEDLIVEEA